MARPSTSCKPGTQRRFIFEVFFRVESGNTESGDSLKNRAFVTRATVDTDPEHLLDTCFGLFVLV